MEPNAAGLTSLTYSSLEKTH